MKRFLLLIFAICTTSMLSAQVVINNSIFPQSGDTLRSTFTADVSSFDKSLVGADVEWDLRGISDGVTALTVYGDPSQGSAADVFPDADLVDLSTGQEIYYRSFNNKIVELGRSGLDPIFNAIDLTVATEGELILRQAPMTFNDAFTSSSSFSIASSADVVPDTLIDLTGIADSLRLSVETEIEDIVDAWGTMRLPNADYDVIRVRRVTTSNSLLELRSPVLGWLTLDESSPFFPLLGPLGDLLGENTAVSYQFFANDSKELIADFSEDTDGNLITASYKADFTTSTLELDPRAQELFAYPNPTYGDITFEMKNMPFDNYKIVVYNIIGKEVWSSNIDYFSGRMRSDLSELQKGTYIYSLLNGNGHRMSTKRLMIVRP